MTMTVVLTAEGQQDFDALPTTIRVRVLEILERLAAYPAVSGAKPLRYDWKGHFRIRTGDYRVVFKVVSPNVIVVRILHRRHVYED